MPKFLNPEVDAKYNFLAEADVKKVGFGYHGPLSKISLAIAAKLVATQDGDISEKKPSASAAMKPVTS